LNADCNAKTSAESCCTEEENYSRPISFWNGKFLTICNNYLTPAVSWISYCLIWQIQLYLFIFIFFFFLKKIKEQNDKLICWKLSNPIAVFHVDICREIIHIVIMLPICSNFIDISI
jgi:hypothetical protein